MKPKTTVFTYNIGTPGIVEGETIPATIVSHEDYLDTGIIPWDIDNPSPEAEAFIKFFGLTRIVKQVKKERKKRKCT